MEPCSIGNENHVEPSVSDDCTDFHTAVNSLVVALDMVGSSISSSIVLFPFCNETIDLIAI